MKRKKQQQGTAMGRPLEKVPGILDEELKMIIDANTDEAPARRRAREAFKDIRLGVDHCLLKIPSEGLKVNEMYEVNSRGLQIFSKSWFPGTSAPKALIFYCHSYGDTCPFFFEGIARKLASSGYGVFAMDCPGFGLSDGLHGYIPRFEALVDDVIEWYSKLRDNPEAQCLPCVLFGHSMGGAVALKVHLKQPNSWNGAVIAAPMCKVADDIEPPWILTKVLIGLSKFLPTAKLVSERNLVERAFREKKELTAYNVIAYKDKARLRTSLECLNVMNEIECRLDEVSLPLLILQGEKGAFTVPSGSRALYEKASSKDKELVLYKDASHYLLEGEPDEVIFRVFDNIISRLVVHSIKPTLAWS